MRKAEQNGRAEAAIWRARLKYATRRFVVDKQRHLKEEADRQRRFTDIVTPIAHAIDSLGSAYRIALFNHLYRMRDRYEGSCNQDRAGTTGDRHPKRQ